jgi:hypothetical protein
MLKAPKVIKLFPEVIDILHSRPIAARLQQIAADGRGFPSARQRISHVETVVASRIKVLSSFPPKSFLQLARSRMLIGDSALAAHVPSSSPSSLKHPPRIFRLSSVLVSD